jgi:RNA polymerase subunit RPABC4/transcription elongation factor Spt4
MTKVDVCGNCGTLFDEDEDHCRRCGADRSKATQQELRDLCVTYTGEDPEPDEIGREVKPIFEPRWGQVQWYELTEEERRAKRKKGS